MAYNLRTGLIGSGDIDVNVSLDNLNAANITAGQFPDARISDLNASKLTGLLSMDRITDDSITKAKIGEPLVAWVETEIPVLPKSKIDPTHSTTWDSADIPSLNASKINAGLFDVGRIPPLTTSQITSGSTFPLSFIPDIPTGQLLGQIASSQLNLIASDIPDLAATKITSGTFASPDRIPALPASKITSGTFPKSQISTAETWPVDDIPYLPATKIASGELDAARIPNLSALKIQSDTLNTDRIPNLDASKITTGTISSERLPATASTSDCLMLRGLMAAYGATAHSKTITTTYAALASQTNGSFTAPASGMVVVTLTFYLVCAHDKAVLARLVKGGTTTEFTSAYSLNSSGITCQETDNVYVVKHTTADSADTFDKQVQVTWLLTGLTSGSTYAIDAHLKTGAGTATANWGDYGSVNHPPILFEVRSIPNSVANVVISEGSGG